MSTYNGWTIIAFPDDPAPSNIQFVSNDIVGVSPSPFTGQQQVYNWRAGYMELDFTYPPMEPSDAAAFIAFLYGAKGQLKVFALPTYIVDLLPAGSVPGGYFRLSSNKSTWSLNEGGARIYGFHFSIREAI